MKIDLLAKKLKKVVCFILAFTMIMSNFVFDMEAGAVVNNLGVYTYEMKFKVSDHSVDGNSGTNDYMDFVIKEKDGTEHVTTIGNNFDNGKTYTKTFSVFAAPWEIESFGLRHVKKGLFVNAVRVDYFEVRLSGTNLVAHQYINGWLQHGKNWATKWTHDWDSHSFKRDVVSVGDLSTALAGRAYFSEHEAGAYTLSWNGMIDDQYGGAYDVRHLLGDPTMTLSINAIGDKNLSWDANSIVGTSKTTSPIYFDFDIGDSVYEYTVNKDELLAKMKLDGVYRVDVTTTLTFGSYYNIGRSFSSTHSIVRTSFDLGTPEVSNANEAGQHINNVYYFNEDNVEDNDTVKIKIPIITTVQKPNANNYSPTNIAKNFAFSEARMYYAGNTNDYTIGKKAQHTPGAEYVMIEFPIPPDFSNAEGDGKQIEIELDNVTSYDGRTYTYVNEDFKPGTGVTSNYKIDTQGAETITVIDSGTEDIDTFLEYSKGKSFDLSFDSMVNGKSVDDNPYIDNVEDLFSFKLVDENGSEAQIVATTNADKSPYVKGTTDNSPNYEFFLKNREEGNYTLEIEAKDRAANDSNASIPMNVDYLAPRVGLNVDKVGIKAEYKFDISDISNSGRLYYCFVKPDATGVYTIPEIPTNPSTGAIDSLWGTWAVVDQDGPTTTAVMAAKKDEIIDGRLYYYTVDDAGNDSRKETTLYIDEKNQDGYFFSDIYINNKDPEGVMTVEAEFANYPNDHYYLNFRMKNDTKLVYEIIGESGTKRGEITPTGQSIVGGYYEDSLFLSQSGGTMTVNYHFKNMGSGLESEKFSQDFKLDAEAPVITVNLDHNDPIATQNIVNYNITDASPLKRVTYRLETPRGDIMSEEVVIIDEVGEALPANPNITISPEESGVYIFRINATDIHDRTTTVITDRIFIRSEEPEVEVTTNLSESAENQILVTNDNDFKIRFDVKESFYRPVYLGSYAWQTVYYKVSTDGVNYSPEWINTYRDDNIDRTPQDEVPGRLEVDINENTAAATFTLNESPAVLNTGENTLYFKVAIAHDAYVRNGEVIYFNSGSQNSGINSVLENTAATVAIDLVYDNVSPEYSLEELNAIPTGDSIFAKIKIQDNFSYGSDLSLVSENDDIIIGKDVEYDVAGYPTFTVEIANNVDDVIKAYDKAGNMVEIPLKVSNIDKEPPTLSDEHIEVETVGDRTHGKLQVEINSAIENSVRFALVDADAIEVTEEDFDNTDLEVVRDYQSNLTPLGNTDTRFNIYPRGIDGTFKLAVYAEDNFGNVLMEIIDEAFTLKDAKVESPTVIKPQQATDVAVVNLIFDVPVYVITEAEVGIVAAELGDVDTAIHSVAPEYGTGYSQYFRFTVKEGETGTYSFYAIDEIGRYEKIEIEIKDGDITFGEGLPVDIELQQWDDETFDYVAVTNPENIVAYGSAGYSNDYLRIAITAKSDATTTSAIEYLKVDPDYTKLYSYDDILNQSSVIEADDAYNDFRYNYASTILAKDIVELSNTKYSQLIFTINAESISKDKSMTFYSYHLQKDSEGSYLDPSIESSYVQQLNTYTISFEDVTVPTILVEKSVTTPTIGSVDVNLRIYDIDNIVRGGSTISDITGISALNFFDDYGDMYENIDPIRTIDLSKIRYDEGEIFTNSDISELEANESISLKGGQVIFTRKFEENGELFITAVNNVGLFQIPMDGVGDGALAVYNINKDPIDTTDFTLKYEYKDTDGTYKQLTDNTKFYQEVRAVIELKDADSYYSPDYRGLYIYNNGGLGQRTLTARNNSFTFVISDSYGYTYEIPVSYDKFDSKMPTVSYSIDDENTKKTNQPITVQITANDLEDGNVQGSGLESVILSGGNLANAELNIPATGGTVGAKINTNGNYTVTATDIVGNKSIVGFTVSNIDTTSPTAIVSYNVDPTKSTTRDVIATLIFNKENVTITNVIPANQGFSDYRVDTFTSKVIFTDNGAVTVEFADEYGNAGLALVNVTNINNIPPNLRLVETPDTDKLKLTVHFEQVYLNGNPVDADGKILTFAPDLKDLTVIHRGVAKPVKTEEGDYSTFELKDTGDYKFVVYDNTGLAQELSVTVDTNDIDKVNPKITKVEVKYGHYTIDPNTNKPTTDVNGDAILTPITFTRDLETPDLLDEVGYIIADDKTETPATNQDVSVTVTTDKATAYIGGEESYSTEHILEYDENGTFFFNLKSKNQLHDSYGVGIYLIDKTPPALVDKDTNEALENLVFYENENAGPRFDASMLNDYKAYDEQPGEDSDVDLTDKVILTYQDSTGTEIQPSAITKYDKTKPYRAIYTVYDEVGNKTEFVRTITLVSRFDSIALVNGMFPDSSNRIIVSGDEITVSVENYDGGNAYAKYAKGGYTMGQMKGLGSDDGVIVLENNGYNEFTVDTQGLENSWYTFYVQTDTADYFTLRVYLNN